MILEVEIHRAMHHLRREGRNRLACLLVDATQIEVKRVAESMDSFVSAARDVTLDRVRHEFAQRGIDAALHCVFVRLFLDARESGAKVLKRRKIPATIVCDTVYSLFIQAKFVFSPLCAVAGLRRNFRRQIAGSFHSNYVATHSSQHNRSSGSSQHSRATTGRRALIVR